VNAIRAACWGRPALPDDFIDAGPWGERYRQVLEAAPYALLLVSVVLSQLEPYASLSDRLVTLALAAVAAAWVYLLYTRPPLARRQRTLPMLVYFAGFLVLSWFLEARAFFFVAFAITGFVQAFFLLPVVPAFAAVAATSAVVYLSPPGSGFRDPGALPVLLFLIALQTAATGGGSFMGMKMAETQARNQKLLADLQASQRENAALQVQLLEQAREGGAMDERQRLAREIHDTLAQGLTGIVTQLEAAEARPEAWRAHVGQAAALARESLREARRSLEALRPEQLEGSRLPDAIAEMARRWSRSASVALRVETTGQPVALGTDQEVTLFRVAQEALANVAKHARATRVGLTLSYMEDVVALDVRDNGAGFTPGATDGGGFGLRVMEQRLRQVGGSLTIESEPGAGTAVSATVPV
jgi:signal transduction histidine kinase